MKIVLPKGSINVLLIAILTAYNCIPELYRYYSFYINLSIILLILLINARETVDVLCSYPNYSVMALICFGIFSFMFVVKGLPITTDGFVPIIIESFLLFIICNVILKKESSLNFLIAIVLLIYIYIEIKGILALQIYPHASREIAGALQGDAALFYLNLGVPNFGHIYAVSFLSFVIFVSGVFKEKLLAVLQIAFLILAFIIIIRSLYTMALIIYLCGGVIFVFERIENKAIRVMCVVVCVVVFAIFNQSILSHVYKYFINNGYTTQATKISQLLAFDTTRDFDSIQRYRLYKESFDNFLSYPIAGANTCGRHSQFLDALSYFGMFGLLFCVILFKPYRLLFHQKVSILRYLNILFFVFLLLNTFYSTAQIVAWYLLLPVFILHSKKYQM